ncbi:hypothetical protein EB230_17295 [Mesorhizobium sp. NZP2234]|uniref:hypothetical protein n=1 Tax=Mesorhizobium sp. NZP2234 TaxID=2483402 RepID=UPI001556687B|nr:hypothetical protein [Mesorhizobium sp. NZP2234]QKC89965.1 hypothetical protein EB230_17295 [Mesorhizobium sp. NZP2234]
MNKTRFLMSALAVVALAFSVCSAPAAEFERVTIASVSYEQPPRAVAGAADFDFAIMTASEDAARMPIAAGARRPAVATFALYRIAKPAAGSHRPYAVPWQA